MTPDSSDKHSKNNQDGLLSNWKKVAGVPECGRPGPMALPWMSTASGHLASHGSSTASHASTGDGIAVEDDNCEELEGEFHQDEDEETVEVA